MAPPAEKLPASLEALETLQEQGRIAIRSADLTRTHRERLTEAGFLKEVIKGGISPPGRMKRPGRAPLGTRPFGAFTHSISPNALVKNGACRGNYHFLFTPATGPSHASCLFARLRAAIGRPTSRMIRPSSKSAPISETALSWTACVCFLLKRL